MRLLFVFCLSWLLLMPAHAHEMGMATLEITETSPGQGHLVFKRSKLSDGRLAAIDFTLQPACVLTPLSTDNAHANELFQSAKFTCQAGEPLHSVAATGFTRLAPELVLQIHREGLNEHAVLTPQAPSHYLGLPQQNGLAVHYFVLGAEHMLLGLDHLLFVSGLFLLWAARRANAKTLVSLITCFTLGHSLTLALLSINVLHLPVRAIEAWIALSVLYLAVKVLFAKANQTFNTTDYGLVIGFGLLHGAGFSAAMLSRGFPEEHLLSTLFAFNVGIEAAQIFAVLTMLAIRNVLHQGLGPRATGLSHQATLMIMGGMALAWTTERVLTYV